MRRFKDYDTCITVRNVVELFLLLAHATHVMIQAISNTHTVVLTQHQLDALPQYQYSNSRAPYTMLYLRVRREGGREEGKHTIRDKKTGPGAGLPWPLPARARRHGHRTYMRAGPAARWWIRRCGIFRALAISTAMLDCPYELAVWPCDTFRNPCRNPACKLSWNSIIHTFIISLFGIMFHRLQ